ncbi:hypothetical protein TNCV_1855201 [Trichonephila clavipes]|nr:hypothetical protein TNCV_1855201 [Trichonephila clavipes]
MADNDILEFIQSSKNIIEADPENEKEMCNAGPVPKSSEPRNVMKRTRMRSYLDSHSNGEMNKTKWTASNSLLNTRKKHNAKHVLQNTMLKTQCKEKYD